MYQILVKGTPVDSEIDYDRAWRVYDAIIAAAKVIDYPDTVNITLNGSVSNGEPYVIDSTSV